MNVICNECRKLSFEEGQQMNKKEALDYCEKHRNEYIRGFESIGEGTRQYDCLITILEEDTITPDELSDYGMDFPESEG